MSIVYRLCSVFIAISKIKETVTFPVAINFLRCFVKLNPLSDLSSVPRLPWYRYLEFESYIQIKYRCVVHGQRQILPNQIEEPRKFNDIFLVFFCKSHLQMQGGTILENISIARYGTSASRKPIVLTTQQILKINLFLN